MRDRSEKAAVKEGPRLVIAKADLGQQHAGLRAGRDVQRQLAWLDQGAGQRALKIAYRRIAGDRRSPTVSVPVTEPSGQTSGQRSPASPRRSITSQCQSMVSRLSTPWAMALVGAVAGACRTGWQPRSRAARPGTDRWRAGGPVRPARTAGPQADPARNSLPSTSRSSGPMADSHDVEIGAAAGWVRFDHALVLPGGQVRARLGPHPSRPGRASGCTSRCPRRAALAAAARRAGCAPRPGPPPDQTRGAAAAARAVGRGRAGDGYGGSAGPSRSSTAPLIKDVPRSRPMKHIRLPADTQSSYWPYSLAAANCAR